jgi:hypothetical protein
MLRNVAPCIPPAAASSGHLAPPQQSKPMPAITLEADFRRAGSTRGKHRSRKARRAKAGGRRPSIEYAINPPVAGAAAGAGAAASSQRAAMAPTKAATVRRPPARAALSVVVRRRWRCALLPASDEDQEADDDEEVVEGYVVERSFRSGLARRTMNRQQRREEASEQSLPRASRT